MDPLADFVMWLVNAMMGLPPDLPFTRVAYYFIYDLIRIFLLLIASIFIMSIVRTYITPSKLRKWLGGQREGLGNLIAAFLGMPTPFCSFSAIPLFVGMLKAGAPIGVAFSFLISAPLVNEVAFALLIGVAGWKAAITYLLCGLTIAIGGGIIIGRLARHDDIEPFVFRTHRRKRAPSAKMNLPGEPDMSHELWGDQLDFTGRPPSERLHFAIQETILILSVVWLYVILGIAVSSVINGYVPFDLLLNLAGPQNLLAVPIAVLIGVPLYASAAGIVPVISALLSKGLALGTALAFMMGVMGLSLPQMIILKRFVKPRLIAIFVAVLAAAFVIAGYLFNLM